MARKEKPADSFVERPQEEQSGSKARRISLRVTDEGKIDWSQVSDKQKESFVEAVTNDPDALEMIGAAVGGDGEAKLAGPVTVEHVKTALDWYAKGEAWAIPLLIKKKSKGLIVIPPDVANAAYQFQEETKSVLAPDGAQFINEEIIPNLPEWLKKFIFEVGPGAKFLGGIALHSIMSTMQLIEYIKTMPKTIEHDPNVTTAASATSEEVR